MRHHRLPRPRSLKRTLVMPAVLLLVSFAGLALALTGDGAADWIAAVLLFLPVFAILQAWLGAGSVPAKTS